MIPQFGKLPKTKFAPSKRLSRGGAFRPNKEPDKPLTGKVKGLKASDDEERFSHVLGKGISKGIVRDYEFRWTSLKRNSIYYSELDFLVRLVTGGVLAIMFVENSFVHRSAGTKEKDKINEINILQKLRELGFNVREITRVPNEKASTEEKAKKLGRELGVYR